MTSEAGNPSSWTVVAQTQQGGQTSTGQFTSGWRVQFRTGTGVDGEVFIPEAEYTVENVRAKITEKVAQLAAIHGLSG